MEPRRFTLRTNLERRFYYGRKTEPKVEKEKKPKKHFHLRKPWEITEDEPDVIDAEFNDVTEEPEKEEN